MNPALRVFLLAFAALFLELLFIRYIAVELKFFAFFKNFALMSVFLGLGIGFGLRRRQPDLRNYFIPLATVLLLLAFFARELGLNDVFLPTSDNQFLWYHHERALSASDLVFFYATSFGCVLLLTVTFVPLGQALGSAFLELPPTASYAWDLAGSISGVLGFTAVSFLGVSPTLAALPALVLSAWLLQLTSRRAKVVVAALLVLLVADFTLLKLRAPQSEAVPPHVAVETTPYVWSSYYRLHTEPLPVSMRSDGTLVHIGERGFINGFHYFDLIDFRLAQDPTVKFQHDYRQPVLPLAAALDHYLVPYRMRPEAQDVLILGAGPGNDAAAALVSDVEKIVAVEIDREVIHYGRTLHPMKPYLEPNIEVVVNDARAHLANETREFDLVLFGHLDSIHLVNSFSSIRLDSYVYTRESLESAYGLVREGGALGLSFASSRFVTDKIYLLLEEATGRPPMALLDAYMGTTTFVVPKGGDREADDALFEAVGSSLRALKVTAPTGAEAEQPVPTDDWPFLFLKERQVSSYYLVALALLLLLGVVATRLTFFRSDPGGDSVSLDWHMLWLGGGFMLIEIKSITELSLLFGSTWVVNGIAIVGVLGMNLAAIAFIRRFPDAQPRLLYLGLALGILANFLLPPHWLLAMPWAPRLIASMVFIYLPLFFAGAVFAQSFDRHPDPPAGFGSNLVGAMIGGSLEYLSIVVGFRALWILGALLYLASWLAHKKRPRRDETS